MKERCGNTEVPGSYRVALTTETTIFRLVSVAAVMLRPVNLVLPVLLLLSPFAFADSSRPGYPESKWRSLMLKGDSSVAQKQYRIALDYYKEAFALARNKKHAWRERLQAGLKLCSLHTRLGHLHVASRVCKQTLAASTRRFGKTALPSAKVALVLARIKMKQDDRLAAVRLARKVLKIAEQHRRTEPQFFLQASRFTGAAYEKVMNLRGARKSWSMLYRELKKISGTNHPALPEAARSVFRVVLSQQDYSACIRWGERIVRLSPSMVSGAKTLRDRLFYIQVARCYFHVGKPATAVGILKTGFPRVKELSAESRVGFMLYLDLARYHFSTGNNRQSEYYLAVVRKAASTLEKKSDTAGIEALVGIANFHYETGRLLPAIRFFTAALAKSGKVPGLPGSVPTGIKIRLAIAQILIGNEPAAKTLLDSVSVNKTDNELQRLHLLSLQLYLAPRKKLTRRLELVNRLIVLAEKYFPFAHESNAVFYYHKFRILSAYRNHPRALDVLRKAARHWQRSTRYLADREFLSSNILMLQFRPGEMYLDYLGILLAKAQRNSRVTSGVDGAETLQVVSVLNLLRNNPVASLYVSGTGKSMKQYAVAAENPVQKLKQRARDIALVQGQYLKVRALPSGRRNMEYEILLRDHIVRSLTRLEKERQHLYRYRLYRIPDADRLRKRLVSRQKRMRADEAVLGFILDTRIRCVLVLSRETVRLVPLVFEASSLANWQRGRNMARFSPDLHLLLPGATLLTGKKTLHVIHTRRLETLLRQWQKTGRQAKTRKLVWKHSQYNIRFVPSFSGFTDPEISPLR